MGPTRNRGTEARIASRNRLPISGSNDARRRWTFADKFNRFTQIVEPKVHVVLHQSLRTASPAYGFGIHNVALITGRLSAKRRQRA